MLLMDEHTGLWFLRFGFESQYTQPIDFNTPLRGNR
jgi:hypothetical protein